MKNHFVSVIGVDYDLDLAPYWIRHYQTRGFDTMTVFLHREAGEIDKSVQDMYRNAGFTVFCIDGPYSGGIVGAFHLRNFIKNLPESDFVTVADADEFQVMSDGSPIPYKALCEEYDVLHGLFEERYADSLSVCMEDPFTQYQHVEPYTGDYLKPFCPPYLKHIQWPHVYRCKIIAARAGEAYRFYGMHSVNELQHDSRILFGLKVIHFNWREGAALKIAKKEWLKSVCKINPHTNELLPITRKEFVEQFNFSN